MLDIAAKLYYDTEKAMSRRSDMKFSVSARFIENSYPRYYHGTGAVFACQKTDCGLSLIRGSGKSR
jgi:hypothetical protein